jgi:hypothetical protein
MPVAIVVLTFEVADHHPSLEQGVPVLPVEAPLPKAIVERFDVAVVPRCAGRYVG